MVRIAYDSESGTEIADDGPYDELHIQGLPLDVIPVIHKYNREHWGPDGDAINITQTCIEALRKEIKRRNTPSETLAEDMEGNKLELGDWVIFTIAHLDPHHYFEGILSKEDGVFCIKTKDDCFPVSDNLLNLHKMANLPLAEGLNGRECECIVVDEGLNSPECSVCDEVAEEMEDPPEDLDGNELEVGDKVSFIISGPDAHNELEGIVTLEGSTYCVQSGHNLFILDNDLLELRLLDGDK